MICECKSAGFCNKHNIFMDEHLYSICKIDCSVFSKKPGTLDKIVSYGSAAISHFLNGSPQADDNIIHERRKICSECPLLKDGICNVCGCPVEEKTKWADQQCPLDPPKWGKTDSIVTAKKGCKSCGK